MENSSSNSNDSLDSAQKPLGEILIEAGLVPISQIELALQEQKHTGLRIGEILVLHGWIEQKTVDFFGEKWCELIAAAEKQSLAYYFQEAGLLKKEQVDAIARLQQLKHKKVRFHGLAVEQNYLKQTTVDFFLAHLFNIYNPKSISVSKPYEILKRYTEGERDFQKTNFSKAPLMNVSLKGVNLDGSNFRKADLSKANLSNSSLIQVNLQKANLSKAILTEVNLANSCLTQANLQEAHLEKVNLQSTILHEVNFQSAYLAQASFAGADLTNAKLPLDYSYEVYYDQYTCFDNDFDPQLVGWTKITNP
jgi:uncharacterized protein YjbI with pentapeptide repeats